MRKTALPEELIMRWRHLEEDEKERLSCAWDRVGYDGRRTAWVAAEKIYGLENLDLEIAWTIIGAVESGRIVFFRDVLTDKELGEDLFFWIFEVSEAWQKKIITRSLDLEAFGRVMRERMEKGPWACYTHKGYLVDRDLISE